MPSRLAAFFPAFLGTLFAISIVAQSQEHYNNYADPIVNSLCPNCNRELPALDVKGWKGHPWRDSVPGGCECDSRRKVTNYNFSANWPSPFSVLMDYGRCGDQRRCTSDTRNSRIRDQLDVFANIRLLAPLRCDNGYSGPHCDPFGYVGQSQRELGPAGLQQPIEREPEIAPIESLTMIPSHSDHTEPTAKPALGRLVEFNRSSPQTQMTQLSQRPSAPSKNSESTVMHGHFPMPSVERKSQGVVWESVAEGVNIENKLLR